MLALGHLSDCSPKVHIRNASLHRRLLWKSVPQLMSEPDQLPVPTLEHVAVPPYPLLSGALLTFQSYFVHLQGAFSGTREATKIQGLVSLCVQSRATAPSTVFSWAPMNRPTLFKVDSVEVVVTCHLGSHHNTTTGQSRETSQKR